MDEAWGGGNGRRGRNRRRDGHDTTKMRNAPQGTTGRVVELTDKLMSSDMPIIAVNSILDRLASATLGDQLTILREALNVKGKTRMMPLLEKLTR